MRILSSFLIMFVISGCASLPREIGNQANKILSPSCYALFSDTGFKKYQHAVFVSYGDTFGPQAAFAFAMDGNGASSCGYSTQWALVDNLCLSDCGASQTELEAHALSLCEDSRKKNNVKSACKIFAINNNIVWDNYKNQEDEFK